MWSCNPRSNQRRSAAHQEPERSTYPPQSVFNQSYGFQRDGYRPGPEYRNHHTYHTERHGTMPYGPTVHGQYDQAYPPVRPTSSQYGPHMDSYDFDYQQYNPGYSDDGETSSTTAVVGSQVPQHFPAPLQPHRNPCATVHSGDLYIPPAHPQLQNGPPIDHGMPYGWATGPVPGQYSGLSHQHGGHFRRPMNQNAFSIPNPGPMPMPTPHIRPQARFNPAQSMQIPQPMMYVPAPAPLPMNYSGAQLQPQGADGPYAAGYQSYIQPPANNPPGDFSTNVINHDQYPPVNNDENIGGPTSIPRGATKSPNRRHRRGKGKGKELERVEATGR